MALNDTEKLFLYNYSIQLMQQDMLTASLFSSGEVGQGLRDLVVKAKETSSLTGPTNEALTGTLRADSRTLSQAAANVREASSLMSTAASGVDQITTILDDMETVLDEVDEGTLTESEGQAQYEDLIAQLDAVVNNTDFNGISLFNGNDWSSDERVSISGETGSIYIQGDKSGGFNISLTNIYDDFVDDGSAIFSTDDVLAANRADAQTKIDDLQSTASSLSETYSSRSSNLSSQATALDNQASILSSAADNRTSSSANSLEDILMNYILSSTGGVVDETS